MRAGLTEEPRRHVPVLGESRCSCGERYDDPDKFDAHVFEARGAALADRMVQRMTPERTTGERTGHSVGAVGAWLLVIAAIVWVVLRYA